MKIEHYQVSLASEHRATHYTNRTETLRAWVGERPDFEGTQAVPSDETSASSARVAISEAARQALAAAEASGDAASGTDATDGAGAASDVEPIFGEPVDDPRLDLLIRLVEALTGRKIRVMDSGEISRLSVANEEFAREAEALQPAGGEQPQGWGVEYDYHEEIYESEQTSFVARGEIRTADGRVLQFDLALHMSREFYQQTSVSFRAGDAVRKDPLVINFDGTAAELSDFKFDFDIDADGEADRIAFVGGASGFLALDRNGNGRIDDGSELFGARTGNGFAELAAFDSDGNGWIDENDAIFAQLRIWTKDASGADQLSTLAEHDIGALYLGSAATPFDLKDAHNQQHGQILSSGVYLREDGRAGTIQQLDLFV